MTPTAATALTTLWASSPRSASPLNDDLTALLLLAVAVAAAIGCGRGRRYVADIFHNMFSVRRRENLFEDHTVRETRTMTALLACACVFGAAILYEAFKALHPDLVVEPMPVFPIVGTLAACAAAFCAAQIGLYLLLGLVFSDKVDTRLWIDGYTASQSLLGIILAPVAVVMLAVPQASHVMLAVAAALYFSARLVFICKGFRIFFNKMSLLLYFILYLCAVEIVPVILSFAGAMKLCIILLQAV